MDSGLLCVWYDACHPLCPQAFKLLFHLAEDELDRVVVWLICHVVDVLEAERPHRVLALLRGVRGEVVHEDADLLALILLPQLRQVLLELGDADGVGEYHVRFLTPFF